MKENDIIIDDTENFNKVKENAVDKGLCYIAHENEDLKDNDKNKCAIL